MRSFKIEVVNALGDTYHYTTQAYSRRAAIAQAVADGETVVSCTE